MKRYHGPESGVIGFWLDRDELERLITTELHTAALRIGKEVIAELIEHEVKRLCGERRKRGPMRSAHRFGRQQGYMTLGGHKVRFQRPRVRSLDGRKEMTLEIYQRLQRSDVLDEAVMRRLVHGVSCRNFARVIDVIRESAGISRSSTSRRFVASTEQRLRSFEQRRFEDIRLAAIFIDGVCFRGQTLVVALGVDDRGRKHVLAIRQGATENATVSTDLLQMLRERGVRADQPTLFVIDGSKALRAAISRIWGENAIVQRCRVHKLRNIQGYVPKSLWPEIRAQIQKAWAQRDYSKARRLLQTTARWLERINPAAGASLNEALDDTLTVTRLNLDPLLQRTFSSTNTVESLLARVRLMTGRVKRWRSGTMRLRWCATALLEAEQNFDRINGYRSIHQLVRILDQNGQRQSMTA